MLTHKSLFVFLLAGALVGCDFASKAIVVVNTPGTLSAPTASQSAQPTGTPQSSVPVPPLPSTANTVINIPSSVPSQPILPIPAPSASVSASADVSIFKTKIPKPSEVRGYLRTEITQATEMFKLRYEANKENAFEVLKMALDAHLVGSGNIELRNSLLPVLFGSGGIAEAANQNFQIIKNLPTPEKSTAMLYQNVEIVDSLNKIEYKDFENRIIQVMKEDFSTGRVEYIPISKPEELFQASPQSGEVLGIFVKANTYFLNKNRGTAIDNAIASTFGFRFVYDNGWKYLYSHPFQFIS